MTVSTRHELEWQNAKAPTPMSLKTVRRSLAITQATAVIRCLSKCGRTRSVGLVFEEPAETGLLALVNAPPV